MFQKMTRRSLDAFLAKHASSARTLDIGGGSTGHEHSRFFPNRTTVDIDPARKPDVVADAHALPFNDASFELVLCTEVLEHLVNPPQAIAEMRRVLAPGGTLILTTRFVYPLHDAPHDYFRFTHFGLEKLLENWSDVSIVPELSTMATLGALFQRLAYQTDMRGGKFSKGLVLACAWCLSKCNWLIRTEYGDIKRTVKTPGIMASGYLVVAHKK
jgi:SAM-dependent methyltransferase